MLYKIKPFNHEITMAFSTKDCLLLMMSQVTLHYNSALKNIFNLYIIPLLILKYTKSIHFTFSLVYTDFLNKKWLNVGIPVLQCQLIGNNHYNNHLIFEAFK